MIQINPGRSGTSADAETNTRDPPESLYHLDRAGTAGADATRPSRGEPPEPPCFAGGGSLPRGGPGRATGPRAAPESPRAARPVVSRLSASLPRAAALAPRPPGAEEPVGQGTCRRSGARAAVSYPGPLTAGRSTSSGPEALQQRGVYLLLLLTRGPWVGRGRSRWAVLSAALSIASLCFVRAHQRPPTVSGQPLRRWAL